MVPLLSCVLVLCLTFMLTHARVGFVKDQSTDFEFPPRILRKFETGIPVGHLRPLGWQRRPDDKVAEEKGSLLPKDFYIKYVKNRKPVVFRSAVKEVPAMTLWEEDTYLKQRYGELDIHVTLKKEMFTTGPQKLKMKKFLREYSYEDWYLSNVVPQEMTGELVLPRCLQCGMRKYLQEAEIWMSSGGTASLLHSHADHNLHCVLAGRKDFILIEGKHRDKMDYVDKAPHPGAGYSRIDMDRVNMFKFTKVADTPWIWSTLHPGDCLFVPAGYLHQVRSYGRSISSTTLWAPTRNIDFADCNISELDQVTSLADVTFLWTYINGDRQLSNSKLNAKSLRHHFNVISREEPHLQYELFANFYAEIMSEIPDHDKVDTVWKLLDPENKGHVTRAELAKLDDKVLDAVAVSLNKPHQRTHDEL